ncbi:MAG: zinc ABC transporter substrate-binding protein, partial [Candidatus Aenigmatarchaeota archaeon]
MLIQNELKILLVLFLISFALLLVAHLLKKEKNTKLNYVTTTSYPVYSLTKQLLNYTNIETVLILKPGMNAHNYEPLLSDIVLVNNASAIIFTNKFFEGWVNKLLNSIDNKNVLIIDAGETIDILCESNNCENKDPHVWLSPKKVLAMTKKIRDELVKNFQEHKKQIDENYKKIELELIEIEKNYYKKLSSCKYQKVYVYHNALGYLKKDYNFEQVAILNNYVPEGEPSMMHLELLSKQMKKENYSQILL